MRALALLLLASVAALASADRLIAAPSGRKVTQGTLKFDAVWEGDGEKCLQSYLAYGLTPSLELALGGEYGGAAIYVAEHSPANKRGWSTSWVQTSGPSPIRS